MIYILGVPINYLNHLQSTIHKLLNRNTYCIKLSKLILFLFIKNIIGFYSFLILHRIYIIQLNSRLIYYKYT